MRQKTKKTDVEIQADVANELNWDTRVSSAEVGVLVKGGVVTLIGVVDSWVKRLAAEEAAHRVRGVLDVANDLEVRTSPGIALSDTEIAQGVRRALEWDVTVPEKDIQSTVTKGSVTLEGTVQYWSQKLDAARAVERLAGVTGVLNRIEIKPPVQAKLTDLTKAVHKALERYAAEEASHIDLRVDAGLVAAEGDVRSWDEKQAILGAIRGTKGVREVSDLITVRP